MGPEFDGPTRQGPGRRPKFDTPLFDGRPEPRPKFDVLSLPVWPFRFVLRAGAVTSNTCDRLLGAWTVRTALCSVGGHPRKPRLPCYFSAISLSTAFIRQIVSRVYLEALFPHASEPGAPSEATSSAEPLAEPFHPSGKSDRKTTRDVATRFGSSRGVTCRYAMNSGESP